MNKLYVFNIIISTLGLALSLLLHNWLAALWGLSAMCGWLSAIKFTKSQNDNRRTSW